MESINMGMANLVISNKLKESYFNDNLIEESKKLTTDFFNVIKNSPILQLEFKVFNNLENKYIENDLAATRFIDTNIKLFETYLISEINQEHNKLKPFLNEDVELNSDKLKLYEAINDLIQQSICSYEIVNVDNIHESFTTILNHIKTPKNQLTENHELELINEDVIEIAINKFNEKYESLDEDDKNLLKKLIKSNNTQKLELLEEYKTDCLNILESVNKQNIEDKVSKTIQKIKEMVYKSKTKEFSNKIVDDIVSLHELKKELL